MLRSWVWRSRVLPQSQGKHSLGAHGGRMLSPAASWSFWRPSPPLLCHGRGFRIRFMPGEVAGAAAAAATAAAVEEARVQGGFPWRDAPAQFVKPAGSGWFLDGILESMLAEICLRGVNFLTGAEAAFVTTAAVFHKMLPSRVRAPKPVAEAAAAGAEGDSAQAAGDEEEPGTETIEEATERAMAAVDVELVKFANKSDGVPYYRLHGVAAKAITRKKLIIGVRRGDKLSGQFVASFSPSLDMVLDWIKVSTQMRNILAGGVTITFQVDVDLVCEETFFVTDHETGQVIQGDKEASARMHRVRLESCFVIKEAIEQSYTWKVIDLDNWLNGNAFV